MKRGTAMYAPGDVRIEEREAPQIVEPTDKDCGVHVAHTTIGGSIAPGGDHEPDDIAELLWRHHVERGEFQARVGVDR